MNGVSAQNITAFLALRHVATGFGRFIASRACSYKCDAELKAPSPREVQRICLQQQATHHQISLILLNMSYLANQAVMHQAKFTHL
jgi:hypothetical protein